MKRLIIFFVIIISNTSHAQSSFIDSVKSVSSFQNQAELAEIYRKIGIVFKNKSKYDKAKSCYDEALRIYSAIPDSLGIASVCNNLGLLYFINSNKTLSLDNYYRAISINEALKNTSGLVKNYLNLGNFYYQQEDFENALEYYYQCRELLEKHNNNYVLASIYLGIGNVLSSKDFGEFDLKQAQNEYLSALNIYLDLSDSLNLSRVYNNLGVINHKDEDYDQAIDYFRKGLALKIGLSDEKGILITYLNIGNSLMEKGSYEESLIFYRKGIIDAIKLNDGEKYLYLISNMVNVYMELGEADSAASLFNEYNLLRDSIYNEEKSRQLTELQTLYETERTTKELDRQKVVAEEKARQNRILLIAVIGLGLLTLAVVILYWQRKRAVSRLREREEELHQQEFAKLQKEQDIQSLHAMMEGQNQERKRIAEDLHDRLGAKLSAIKLFHQSTQHKSDKFVQVDEMLNETINETREIAHNLAPSALTKYGLIQAIQDLLDTIDSTDTIDVQFSHTNINKRLPEPIETALYYIVQELVTNTLRHSNATSLSVHLGLHDDLMLNLCYEDNGGGFDLSTLNKDSMGLRNMRTRLTPFGGKLSIDSVLNHGATFIIDIDLHQFSI